MTRPAVVTYQKGRAVVQCCGTTTKVDPPAVVLCPRCGRRIGA